jgi:hypothetical protein
MPDRSFRCRALIPGREAIAPLRIFTAGVGNWIQGTVVLRDEDLRFSTNALKAMHQQDGAPFVLAYGDIASCDLGRLAIFLKTVDLETSRGTVRFRCLFAWNETLLAVIRKRL